jgi:hypothetical protein
VSDQNPYEPPRAEVRDEGLAVDLRFRWKAVLYGALTDIGGSIAASAVFIAVIASQATGEAGALDESVNLLAVNPSYLLIWLVVGTGLTVLGGYVAGRVARHTQLKHALVAGVVSMLIGILIAGESQAGPYEGLMNTLGYGLPRGTTAAEIFRVVRALAFPCNRARPLLARAARLPAIPTRLILPVATGDAAMARNCTARQHNR